MINNTSINVSEKQKITIALCVCILILVALGIYANYKTMKYQQSMLDVNLSGKTITYSQDVLNLVVDIRSSYTKYIITKDSSFIKSFDRAQLLLKAKLSELTQLPLKYNQRVLLDSIHTLTNEQRQTGYNLIIKRKFNSFLTAWNYLNNGDENVLLNKITYSIQTFITNEKKSQSANLVHENENFRKVIYVVIISVTVSVLIILFTLLYIRKIYQRLIDTEKLLLKSQLRLESILDKLPIGVLIVNTRNNEYHANHKAVELLSDNLLADGKLYDTSQGAYTFSGVLEKSLRNKLLLTSALKGEESIGANDTIIHIDGKPIPFRVSATPLYNEKGTLEYAISVFDDISNLKAVENELLEAKKLVEESLKLKESFLSNMSHEIRTPINAILGFAELLAKKDLGAQENEYVRIIGSAGENLLRLLNDILDFSKLESNMMVFEEHPISIDGVLSSICNLYLPKAKSKNLLLAYECAESLPDIVVGDPTRLTQVITNIVGNAIKFTQKGSVLLFARSIEETESHVVVQIDIKDSGIGISRDKLSRVFKRFEQAGVETTRYYGGTGLGLSIAKHIVESQGGKISVTSELGIGSVFTFSMPFKKYVGDKNKPVEPVEEVLDLSFLKGLKILLVEDNKLNIKLIDGIFMGYGTQMDIAEKGGEALLKVRANPYDIILMDIELPDISGYDTTKIIRNDLELKTPIIALTAHVLAGEKERCIQAGMNDYLTKPVNTKQLFEKIKTFVTKPHENNFAAENIPDEAKNSTEKSAGTDRFFSTDNVVLNLNYLHELADNNKEFEREVIEMFVEQTPPQISELQTAMQTKDYKQIKMIAHKLKSSTAVAFGRQLMPHFELLEDNAVKNDLTANAYNSLQEVMNTLHAGIKELQKLLETEYK